MSHEKRQVLLGAQVSREIKDLLPNPAHSRLTLGVQEVTTQGLLLRGERTNAHESFRARIQPTFAPGEETKIEI